MRFAPHLPVVLLLGGCMPLHTYGSARTLQAGETEHQIVLDVAASAMAPDDPAPYLGSDGLAPLPRYTFRHGLTGTFELGLSGYVAGFAADLKVALLQSRAIAVAVDPGVSISGLRDAGSAFQARLPLMVELPLTAGTSLRPTLIAAYAHRIDERRTAALLGGSLGVGLRLGRGVTLEPAVSLLVDPDVVLNYYGAGIGLQLGGTR